MQEILKRKRLLIMENGNKQSQKLLKKLKICYPRFLRRRGTHARFLIIFIIALVAFYILPSQGSVFVSQMSNLNTGSRRLPSRSIKNLRLSSRRNRSIRSTTRRRTSRRTTTTKRTRSESTKMVDLPKIDFPSPPSIQSDLDKRIEDSFNGHGDQVGTIIKDTQLLLDGHNLHEQDLINEIINSMQDSSKSTPTSEPAKIIETTPAAPPQIFQGAKDSDETVLTEDEVLKIIAQRDLGITVGPNLRNVKIIDKNGDAIDFNKIEQRRGLDAQLQFVKSSNTDEFENLNDLIESELYSVLPDDVGLFLSSKSPYFNDRDIRRELNEEENRRTANGDDDIRTIMKLLTLADLKSVPNIVHYIWFGCRELRTHHYLSLLSALQIQEPDYIFFHTDCPPTGPLWNDFQQAADEKLKVIKRSPPQHIWGLPLKTIEHKSDVARLQILLQVGGIYADDDLIFLKSLNPLREYEMVLGEENYDALANTIIMASSSSWFLRRWYWEYKSFDDTVWSQHSCFVPWSLWHVFPNTVHVEKKTMLRPNWEEISLIYRTTWDWRNNYSIHLFARFMPYIDKPDRTINELRYLNTTYGEIARFTLYKNATLQTLP